MDLQCYQLDGHVLHSIAACVSFKFALPKGIMCPFKTSSTSSSRIVKVGHCLICKNLQRWNMGLPVTSATAWNPCHLALVKSKEPSPEACSNGIAELKALVAECEAACGNVYTSLYITHFLYLVTYSSIYFLFIYLFIYTVYLVVAYRDSSIC